MTDIAIKVENLSKLYHIGAQQEKYPTLRSALVSNLKHLTTRRSVLKADSNTIWALKDVSFDVKQGEIIGIIGRNGAGKSTLLKVLAHITEPTKGRVSLYGRVGSLLEVGTGFHPELTGRDNIYLNGAILGMKRAEIECKFDEIVAFAEIEKFLNTPVKRYSSGMYVRLAFAVAAHLEPEILIVDEVLSVGDVAFQKKCLGKIGDVASEGRTVLFVSHNMQAIQMLCSKVFLFNGGRIISDGDPQSIISKYIGESADLENEKKWPIETAPGDEKVKLTAIRVLSENSGKNNVFLSSNDLFIEIEFLVNQVSNDLCVGYDLLTADGSLVFRSFQTDMHPNDWPIVMLGKNKLTCKIPSGFLNANTYYVCPRIGLHNHYWITHLEAVVKFEIILDHGKSPMWSNYGNNRRPGIISPIFQWTTSRP
jgi:lipopolysaccharide transport system ATP-binding protein